MGHNHRHNADKRPTLTVRVEQVLGEADDFMRGVDVAKAAGISHHQALSTLHHLRKHKAAEAMPAEETVWWYLTPDTDTRGKKVELRVVEEPGSRRSCGKRRQKETDRG